jgi:hypothetical protein
VALAGRGTTLEMNAGFLLDAHGFPAHFGAGRLEN